MNIAQWCYCRTPRGYSQQAEVEEVTCLSSHKMKRCCQLEDTLRQIQQLVTALINLSKMRLWGSGREGMLRWNLCDWVVNRKNQLRDSVWPLNSICSSGITLQQSIIHGRCGLCSHRQLVGSQEWLGGAEMGHALHGSNPFLTNLHEAVAEHEEKASLDTDDIECLSSELP